VYRIKWDKSRTLLSHFENKYVDSSRALGYTGILTINRKDL